MKKVLFLGILMAMSLQNGYAETTSDSVNVTLQNARRTIGYKGALVVDGKTVTLKNKTLTATEGNEIAVLVVNGGKLVLDHCTIQKTGDGIRQRGQGRSGPVVQYRRKVQGSP